MHAKGKPLLDLKKNAKKLSVLALRKLRKSPTSTSDHESWPVGGLVEKALLSGELKLR
jgi:hypothetical protein